MEGESNSIVIVSGLPRSGTSLMMQIVEAGGIPAFTDGIRFADADNPRGYFEWEDIKKIGRDHRILDHAVGSGKAIKVISTLLPKLPKAHRYKVLFVERDIEEVVQSQQKMLAARSQPADTESLAETAQRLKNHNDQIARWVKEARHIDALFIDHRKLIQNPKSQIEKLIPFLEQDISPHLGEMVAAVDPKLYRNRANNPMLARLVSMFSVRNSAKHSS